MKKYYEAIEQFHKKFKMKGTNDEDMQFRLNLLIEELGELAQVVTKGKSKKELIEENIDLLNLTIGNFISLGISFSEVDKAFWKKWERIMSRKKKKVGSGKFRVSDFKK
ncbi:MAG: nucleoside triphosphate pyrophosphohydrolase family protein [Candidatus Pacebacteria bacterium]|nr:nucleoside triphosphate pyrophosphohydrolase family protein [Candidatus Paceibacterota bacterium]